jgi:pyruvate,water dikinase
MNDAEKWVKPFAKVGIKDLELIGGKNASLGEMFNKLSSAGVEVPDGFATTSDAFRLFINKNHLSTGLSTLLEKLDDVTFSNLNQIGENARSLIMESSLPEELIASIKLAYYGLCGRYGKDVAVAVRSSATAEDLPTASFAGQHDSFLHVQGVEAVLDAVKKCYASLYNARAIKYRIDQGFQHDQVLISAGVQLMVRSDLSSAGVCFSIEPDSGFRDVVVITGCWGLGENIVQGTVTPDEFQVYKPFLSKVKQPIISRKKGSKLKMMVYDEKGSGTLNLDTPIDKQDAFTLTDDEVEKIAAWAVSIEAHYGMPMDIEWAKDGLNGRLYIVQARPETVHSARDPYLLKEFHLKGKGKLLTSGSAVGNGVAAGKARLLVSPAESGKLLPGEILVTDLTNPDWDPIMKKAAGIITNKGGRTSHAAIVAREVGAIAIVGAGNATEKIKDGEWITVDNSQGKIGKVFEGKLEWDVKEHDFRNMKMPDTRPMFILADPEKAFTLSFYPNQGVGLMRLEFVINHSIQIHPMALAQFDDVKNETDRKKIEHLTDGYESKEEYFIDKLSQAVGTIAAAFYPKDVIVRMSDFKSNEYAQLLGGSQFELQEENPMIGFRGASRYYHERYKPGFKLECAAMKRVREEMGFNNVKLMIPFCRTVEEGKKVVDLMADFGLKRGEKGLEIYVMAEIPSNVILAASFAEVFDGFSIGSNDLTQLTLGIDRDSAIISELFDENNPAVKFMIEKVIGDARASGAKIGLCGQAPSDDPAFAGFLIHAGIHSISFNPDAILKGIENMLAAENKNITQIQLA